MKRLILGCLVISSSACASLHASSGENFTMTGTPEAIRAYSDMVIGMSKTAKESANARNQYFEARKSYEAQVTARSAQPGLFQKLFSQESSENQGS